MLIKRFVILLMAVVLTCGGFAAASGAEASVYELGDNMEDFTVTLSDGQTVSLYALLAEKKMVLINFWATWCAPCRREFPYMQEAYDLMSDDVGIVALSINEPDTDEIINDYKEEVGMTTLPLGRDNGLAGRFVLEGYPTSVVVDRNGVICMIHAGSVPSTKLFTNLFSIFTGDDYSESVLLTEMPQPEIVEATGAEELTEAITAPGSGLICSSRTDGDIELPFIPSEDGTFARSANADNNMASSNVKISFAAKAGDVLSYEYYLNGRDGMEMLVAYLDGEFADLHSGQYVWWTGAGVPIETDGEHELEFVFKRGPGADIIPEAGLRGARLLTGTEAASFEFPAPPAMGTLSGRELAIEALSPDKREVVNLLPDGAVEESGSKMYILNADSADIKLLVGEEIDARRAVFAISRGSGPTDYYMLNHLPSENGEYLFTVDLNDTPDGVTAMLVDDILNAGDIRECMLFAGEENAKGYVKYIVKLMQAQYPENIFNEVLKESIAYKDGPVIITLADALTGEGESLPEEVEFVVNYKDADGNPVANVMTQICDDSVCIVLVSDENGVVRHPSAPQPYEIHVLMVPQGFEPVTEVYHMDAAGGELNLTLEKSE